MAMAMADEAEKTLLPKDMDLLLVARKIQPSSMRRWVHEGFLPKPSGRTRKARWPLAAFAEAAVIQHLRHDLVLVRISPEGLRIAIAAIRQIEAGEKPDNRINPSRLTRIDRDALRDAFLVIRQAQAGLGNAFGVQ